MLAVAGRWWRGLAVDNVVAMLRIGRSRSSDRHGWRSDEGVEQTDELDVRGRGRAVESRFAMRKGVEIRP